MIRFLIKGLLRDRQRSFLPMLVVAIGVMLTVFMHTWVTGVIGDSIEFNARFDAGHLRVVTRAYADNISQVPVDLALTGTGELKELLEKEYPDVEWVERTKFGGLIDVPDEIGETTAQGPVTGIALDFLSPSSAEAERMNLTTSMVQGHLPSQPGEILMSDELFRKLNLSTGDEVTLISSTMYGAMSFYNFRVSGTVAFGTSVLDRGTIIIDNQDAELALDMTDASGEILGYLREGYFDAELTGELCEDFNKRFSNKEDEFSPVMLNMKSLPQLASIIDISDMMTLLISIAFVLVMSIVLWNTGLISGLRRYGEIGVRLAIGENKGHVYRSMINESLVIGLAGSVIGTSVGLGFAWLLQTYGLNFGDVMDNGAVMMPNTFRAHITPPAFYIGFIPGVLSIVLGTMLSGIGIYKRKTAQLFKELE